MAGKDKEQKNEAEASDTIWATLYHWTAYPRPLEIQRPGLPNGGVAQAEGVQAELPLGKLLLRGESLVRNPMLARQEESTACTPSAWPHGVCGVLH